MTSSIEKREQSALTQYGSFDLEEMQSTAEQLPKGGGQMGFKPRQGKNVVRFIPPVKGKKPTKIWYKHFFSLGGDRRQLICTKYQYGQHCPVCDMGQKLRMTGNELDSKKARSYEPQAQVYVNIVDMQEPEKGVQLWKMSQGLFKDIMAVIDQAEVGNTFAHPTQGFNIVFNRAGEEKSTKYDAHMVARQSTPLPDADVLLPTQFDLEAMEQAPSDEEQEIAVNGEYEMRTFDNNKKGGGRSKERTVSGTASRNKVPDYDEDVP